MKISLNWLREFVLIELTVTQLAERLTMAGLEVEGSSAQGAEAVQIAHIVRIDPHPQADHLVVCQISTGGETVPVVCGATNMQVGDRVAFAPVGSCLPGGQAIEQVEIRGQSSYGMLCSAAELGLSADQSGLLILPAQAPLGEAVFGFLGLRDTILEISITPNRGDCLSILGLAREVAALTGVPLHDPKLRVREAGEVITGQARVTVSDPDLCPRYATRIVTGVKVASSPAWMKWRLEGAGVRALNNLVDVTNYVMLERGQPLHAFDLALLAGPEIIVRRARDLAALTTLDGKERLLSPEDLLICDRDRGVAIAGVMGGQNSEVSEHTTAVLLESAYFVPETVRRTARRLGLRSEASYRFERGVDPQGTVVALHRAAVLLTQLAGGHVSRGVIDECPRPLSPATIVLRAQRVDALLGTVVEPPEIERCMRVLGARVKRARGTTWQVTVPSHRADLTQEADLIEEVARLRGYETIPTLLPRAEMRSGKQEVEGMWTRKVRACLAAQGLTEMLHLSFTSARLNSLFPGLDPAAAPIPVLNPLSAEGTDLRLSVLGGLVTALQLNLRQSESCVAAFELGKVFFGDNGDGAQQKRQERVALGGVLLGTYPAIGIGLETRRVDFADLKGVLEALWQTLHCEAQVQWTRAAEVPFLHPGKAALLSLDGTPVGVAGALHPRCCLELSLEEGPWVFELDYTALVTYARPTVRYRAIPRFPVVVRDIAVVADEELPVQAVIDAVNALAHPLITSIRLFDLYRGGSIPAQKKSLAYSIAYQAVDRTLTATEVNALHAQVVEQVVSRLGVEIRA